jgi:hypothetical protein
LAAHRHGDTAMAPKADPTVAPSSVDPEHAGAGGAY